jgi:hypothetical protein
MYLVQPFDLWLNHRRLSPLIYSKAVNAETPAVGAEKCSLMRRTWYKSRSYLPGCWYVALPRHLIFSLMTDKGHFPAYFCIAFRGVIKIVPTQCASLVRSSILQARNTMARFGLIRLTAFLGAVRLSAQATRILVE